MQVQLRKYGNSTVAVLPPALLRELGLAAGSRLKLDTTADGRLILSPQPRYRLEELLALCDANAPRAADLADWEAMPPVGGELG